MSTEREAQRRSTDDDADDGGPTIDLLPHQDAELAHLLDGADVSYPLTFICGGRGSGKSETDYLQLFLRSERCVDQPFLLCANTEAQLQTFIGLITEKLDAIGMAHVYETMAPAAWRKRWRREGIRVPPRRLRNLKMWIWEDGTHIACLTLVNNSYTRVKSLDCQAGVIEEATEPGVTRAAITTILGSIRCGLGKSIDGQSECKRRGHLHELVVKFNVPLHDPSNYVYRYVDELQAKELQRKHDGKPPFFRLIESATRDNPHTGDEYDDRLRAALDADTYEQQTSGKLVRNVAALSYHQFSAANILSSLTYDPKAALHIWFDWNATPATSGWGQYLRDSQVPVRDLRSGRRYFGINGELFSDADPMQTEQVASALLEDPAMDTRCRELKCGHDLARDHVETANGFLCKRCQFEQRLPGGVKWFCSGKPIRYEATRKYIHAPDNWHGLTKHRGRIYVYGDASGTQNHADGPGGGCIKIIRDMFTANLEGRVHFRFKPSNPAVRLRVLAVNRGFLSADGVHTLFSAPWCAAHNDDFREVVPDKDGKPLKKTRSTRSATDDYWKRTHSSDGFGYFWDYVAPAIIPRASGATTVPELDGMEPIEHDDWPRP